MLWQKILKASFFDGKAKVFWLAALFTQSGLWLHIFNELNWLSKNGANKKHGLISNEPYSTYAHLALEKTTIPTGERNVE